MDKKELIRLLRKYLDGTASQEEKSFLEAYYKEMDPLGDHAAHLERIMTHAEADLLETEMFENVVGRIRGATPVRRLVYLKYAAVAASVLILLSTGFFFYRHGRPSIPSYADIYTRPGKIQRVQLADGSVAWMNAGSHLRFLKTFPDTGSRDVYLEGEAYFEVAKDPGHPFLVHTQNLTTRVLGTKFNVNAYPGDPRIEVTLLEGKVMLTAHEDTIFLSPNQKAYFSGTTLALEKKSSAPVRHLDSARALVRTAVSDAREDAAWKDGELVFRQEPLSDVIATLGRTYDIEVKAAPSLLTRTVTLTVNAPSPDDALLQVIRQLGQEDKGGIDARNIQFRKEGNVYYIE